MEKKLLASVLALGLLAATAHAHEQTFTAQFSGPDASASGFATLTLSADHTALAYSIDLDGLDLGGQTAATGDDVLGLHFHNAPAGSNGGIVFGLIGSGALGGALNPALTDDADDLVINAAAGTITGVWETTDSPALTTSLLDELMAQRLYLNVHTGDFGGGAIRGQIVPEPASILLLAVGAAGLGLVRRR